MLRCMNEIKGYGIQATDGSLGSADDFYFDDKSWIVRYVVVDTGKWLPGRRVLISPVSIESADWTDRRLHISIPRERVKDSPGIEKDKPVSRQEEARIARHYAWPIYWSHPTMGIPGASAVATPSAIAEAEREENRHIVRHDDPNLRSAREVEGYHIHARDGEIGHVQDFIVDDESWIIRYLVVDTRNWLPGRKVLVSPRWIERISWGERQVAVDLKRDEVKNSPPYDPTAPINPEYEVRLYDYYGRPAYWR